ncbi:unnamed protein product [Lymnaea stagnalis]|uniref:Suppressor APC domain-containing protein n=1 Tax=Lymnaea stagnalis TaxID=6523 RepID=A0AAV2HLP9_LYMST
MNTTSSVKRDPNEGLPKQFLSSLRILFDILDENQSGFVHLRDIESRWSDDGVKGLPPGVLEGLRKVTPSNGLLSFDKFVAGLKLVLINKREMLTNDGRKPFASKENQLPSNQGYNYRKASHATLSDADNNKFRGDAFPHSARLSQSQQRYGDFIETTTARDTNDHYSGFQPQLNHIKSIQNSKSGPQLQRDFTYNAHKVMPDVRSASALHQNPPPQGTFQGSSNNGYLRRVISSTQMLHVQEKPRIDQPMMMGTEVPKIKKSISGPNLQSQSPPAVPPRDKQSSVRVLNELKNWQREWSATQSSEAKIEKPYSNVNSDTVIYANIDEFQKRRETHQSEALKASVRRHGSGRRHTLANGIDQNMLKRMKQLEEEMSILRTGLAMVDTARDWYKKKMQAVSEKQAMLGKVNYNDNSVEAHQERMNFQRARIAEVNQHLHALVESSDKGFPIHMNLVMPSASSNVQPGDSSTSHRIKEQNRRLLEEIGQKTDVISQLEKEKSTLVRELFEARSKNKSGFDDTTFM